VITSRVRAIVAVPVVLVVLSVAACTEEPPTTASTVDDMTDASARPEGDFDSVVEEFAGEEASFGTVPDEPVVADGEAIKIGLINQEDVPIGSFPEVRLGALAAAAFVNEELGGIDGRPLEVIPCIADFSVEGSQKCAQDLVQDGVVAVVGGLDITSNGSIPVLEQNGVPYVGGIPVNFDEMRSPISFQFSGGSPGAMTAFASHAADSGAERVAVVYADYGPIKAAAIDYGVNLLSSMGVEQVTQVPYAITATDMLPILTQAAEGDPDAILMFAADTACVRTMQTAADLALDADIYLVGSCAAPAILDEAGEAAEGIILSIEGPLEMSDEVVDGPMYLAASERYGTEGFDPQSAGTVSFRALMNLYAALQELGGDGITSEALIEHLRSARDVPSYDGHPYTCDGQQIPDLPAMCAPQQVLARVQDGGLTLESDGWIDVPAILAEHGTGR
jgi:branched-chain amino acid transport system substrate-binding protein